MATIQGHRLDFERAALLRQRIEEVASDLGFEVGDVDIHEDATDEGHKPYITVEFTQFKRPE